MKRLVSSHSTSQTTTKGAILDLGIMFDIQVDDYCHRVNLEPLRDALAKAAPNIAFQEGSDIHNSGHLESGGRGIFFAADFAGEEITYEAKESLLAFAEKIQQVDLFDFEARLSKVAKKLNRLNLTCVISVRAIQQLSLNICRDL